MNVPLKTALKRSNLQLLQSQLYDFGAKSRKHDVTFISRYKGDLPLVSSQPFALPPISHLTARPTHSSRRGVLRRQLPKCQVPWRGGKLYVNSCACAIEQIVMSGERKCLHCRDWHAQTEPHSTLVHVKPVALLVVGGWWWGPGDGGLVMGSWWWGEVVHTPHLHSSNILYVIQTPSSPRSSFTSNRNRYIQMFSGFNQHGIL